MTKIANFSDTQVSMISGFKGSGDNGALTFADATAIASLDGMALPDGTPRSPKSIVAKIGRLNLPYQKKVAARKDGTPVQSKADLVEQIAGMIGVTFTALDKAGREDLVKLRDAIAA